MARKRYKVIIKKRSEKDIVGLPKPFQKKVSNKIDGLEANPRPHGTEPVVNLENGYRILYQINDRKIEVLVVRVRHRKDVYRSL